MILAQIVKTSLLALAGLGLFAGVPLLKGQVVCDYTGTILTTSEAIRYTPSPIYFVLEVVSYRLADKRYLMRLGPQLYVDASKDICTSSLLADALHRRAIRCKCRRACGFTFRLL